MGKRAPLSVTVITLDEERNLDRCLRSVTWAEEIVVVDCGSTDGTVDVARRHGATVLEQDWLGFVEQKNLALARASHDWVLSLDADEWLTEAGGAEIRAVLEAPAADGYALNRRTAFSGAFLRGGWSPDWQVRLFRRERGRFEGGRVHESVRLRPGSRVRRLEERLPHLAYRSLHDYVERLNRYTDLAAQTLHDRGRRAPWWRVWLAPPATFLKLFLLRRAFLDGRRGLAVSLGSAFYVALKYLKLWELTRRPDPEFLETSGTTPEDRDPGRP